MKSQQINTNKNTTALGRVKKGFGFLGLSILCAAPLANAAPGQSSTSLSPLCSVLAPSSFTVPDSIKGKETGFRASILSNDKTTIPAIFKIDAFEKDDFSFVTYTATLPTFPIIQPSLLNPSVGELTNITTTAEIRYVIGGGNSANEVCVYSYQLLQVAGQFIRTGLSTVDVKFAKP